MESLGLDGTVCYSWPTDKTNFPTEPFSKFVDDGIKTFDRYNNANVISILSDRGRTAGTARPAHSSRRYTRTSATRGSVVTTDRSPAEFERGLRAIAPLCRQRRFPRQIRHADDLERVDRGQLPRGRTSASATAFSKPSSGFSDTAKAFTFYRKIDIIVT